MNRELLMSLPLATTGAQELPNGYPVLGELVSDVQPRTKNPASPGLPAARNLMAHIQRVLHGYNPIIHRRYWNCNCNTDSYVRGIGYCGELVVGAGTGRTLRIHYHKFGDVAERINALTSVL
jgi:hypothetical protein